MCELPWSARTWRHDVQRALGLTGITLIAFVACGSEGSDSRPVDGSDGGLAPGADADAQQNVPAPDAGDPDGGDPDGGDPEPPAFEIQSKDVVIQPSMEVTYCYHFATPNTEPLAINRWKAVMTPGVQFMALVIGGTDEEPDTLSGICPDISTASAEDPGTWVFTSTKAESELVFPGDDGTSKPLAFELPPGRKGYLLMHHVNTTAAPITAHVKLTAGALPEGAAFTKTSPFITYNDALSIPGFASDLVATKTCNTVPDTKFWSMTTHTHKQGVGTSVRSGASVAYESSDWADPVQKTWPASPFFTFDQDKLTYECVYTNPTNRTITSGRSFAVDERCMAIGYYFPATKPVICYCIDLGCTNL